MHLLTSSWLLMLLKHTILTAKQVVPQFQYIPQKSFTQYFNYPSIFPYKHPITVTVLTFHPLSFLLTFSSFISSFISLRFHILPIRTTATHSCAVPQNKTQSTQQYIEIPNVNTETQHPTQQSLICMIRHIKSCSATIP